MVHRRRRRDPGLDTRTPVVLLGGAANALSLMRSYGRAGVNVSAIMARNVDLLDKARTLELARAGGVPTPRVWAAADGEMVDDLPRDIEFPVILKPLDTHRHHAEFGHKFRFAGNASEFRAHREVLTEHDIS